MSALDARIVVDRPAFRLEVTLDVAAGDVVAVMGPSGAGKSTLLGVVAGLIPLDEGQVRLGGRILDAEARPSVRTPPHRRGIVILGQDPRLFPHLTARDNVAFGLRAHGVNRSDAAKAAREWLGRVGLGDAGARRPSELSGGQQQRVALARALATAPAALLLDEPLTSLDTETAADVRALLRDQLADTGTTTLVATHDAVDAVALASRLVVLENGRVTQAGPVRDVLARPVTRFTAAVAGLNRVVGDVRGGRWRSGSLEIVMQDPPEASDVAAVFRPSDVEIIRVGQAPAAAETGADVKWSAGVTRLEPTPAGIRIRTHEPDVAVDAAADRVAALGIAVGDRLVLRVARADVRFVPVPTPALGERPGRQGLS